MATRPVKVSGYVRTRRKGKSIVTTMVRSYERARPERAPGTPSGPSAEGWACPPKTDGYPAASDPRCEACGRTLPPRSIAAKHTLCPACVVNRRLAEEAAPASKRRVVAVEGSVVYVGNGGPPAALDVCPNGAPSLQDLLESVEGRRVRVTVEVLDEAH